MGSESKIHVNFVFLFEQVIIIVQGELTTRHIGRVEFAGDPSGHHPNSEENGQRSEFSHLQEQRQVMRSGSIKGKRATHIVTKYQHTFVADIACM